MPKFTIDEKEYHNPVEYALEKIGGRWKMPILWRLGKKSPQRYGELKKSIEGISHKMLSQQLRELERNGLITRKMYPQVPPKVEYSLTQNGKKLMPAIEELRRAGNFLKEESLKKVDHLQNSCSWHTGKSKN